MTPFQAIAQLTALKTQSREAMMRGEKLVADIIVQEAKEAAPGSLPGGIYDTQNEVSTVIVGGEDLAAYVNYGTGNFAKEYVASLPKEQQEEAIKFFVSGKGHGSPNPFFTNAIFANEDKILPTIDEELQKLAQ